MTNHVIDNSASDINKVVLWQYDKAYRLLSLIHFLKVMYGAAVGSFWDKWIINVLDIDTCTEFGASVWSGLLGISRPYIVDKRDGDHYQRPIDLKTFRKYIKACFSLFSMNFTLNELLNASEATSEGYLKILFSVDSMKDSNGDKPCGVVIKDNHDMSITYEKHETYFDKMDYDQQELFNQLGNEILPFPAGIRNNINVERDVFGFNTQHNIFVYSPNTSMSQGLYYLKPDTSSVYYTSTSISKSENTSWADIEDLLTYCGEFFSKRTNVTNFSVGNTKATAYETSKPYSRFDIVTKDGESYCITQAISAGANSSWDVVQKVHVGNNVSLSDNTMYFMG